MNERSFILSNRRAGRDSRNMEDGSDLVIFARIYRSLSNQRREILEMRSLIQRESYTYYYGNQLTPSEMLTYSTGKNLKIFKPIFIIRLNRVANFFFYDGGCPSPLDGANPYGPRGAK